MRSHMHYYNRQNPLFYFHLVYDIVDIYEGIRQRDSYALAAYAGAPDTQKHYRAAYRRHFQSTRACVGSAHYYITQRLELTRHV